MRKLSGRIVAWNRPDGQRQIGVAYHAEQRKEYRKEGKLFVRLTNFPIKYEDGCWKVDERETMNVIVSEAKVETIGYID